MSLGRKWDLRFLRLARHIAEWSKDPTTKVGAVIAHGRFIRSLGYNGFPQGVRDDPALYEDREEKLLRMLHAEQNALATAMLPLHGCTLYVYPVPPCSRCMAEIIQHGLRCVVAPYPSEDYLSRWRRETVAAVEMAKQAGVEMKFYAEKTLRQDQP